MTSKLIKKMSIAYEAWLLVMVLIMAVLYFFVFITPDRLSWYRLHFGVFSSVVEKFIPGE